ncbi:hypothetical protein V6N11_047461 [Hibiscus sabdariffa]|uniref:Uncharacterized protein n=1 Tax=Hibiscus sabdariffa TaxID=183260 RepID=A0ABR2A9Q7_9ROSI
MSQYLCWSKHSISRTHATYYTYSTFAPFNSRNGLNTFTCNKSRGCPGLTPPEPRNIEDMTTKLIFTTDDTSVKINGDDYAWDDGVPFSYSYSKKRELEKTIWKVNPESPTHLQIHLMCLVFG